MTAWQTYVTLSDGSLINFTTWLIISGSWNPLSAHPSPHSSFHLDAGKIKPAEMMRWSCGGVTWPAPPVLGETETHDASVPPAPGWPVSLWPHFFMAAESWDELETCLQKANLAPSHCKRGVRVRFEATCGCLEAGAALMWTERVTAEQQLPGGPRLFCTLWTRLRAEI